MPLPSFRGRTAAPVAGRDMGHRIEARESGAGTSTPARLLHYLWPVALGWTVATVAGRATGLPVSPAGRDLLLLGIGAAYSYDRLADPAEAASPALLALLRLGFVACAAGTLMLLPRMPVGTLALLPVLSTAVLAYRWAKAYPWVKALLVPLVWTWAGLALPLADGSWLGWRSLAHPVALPLFLLLAAGCLLCDVNDAARDRARGVRSLPVQVGVGRTLLVAALVAIVGAATGLAQGRLGLVADGLLLAALAACRPLLMLESWGPLAVDLALTLPGILILAHLI